MKKVQLFIILLIVLVLFAYADYAINVPEGIKLPSIPRPNQTDSQDAVPAVVSDPNVTLSILETSDLGQSLTIEKRTRSTALFESFDLRNLADISIYSNVLTNSADPTSPIYIDEIHGPAGQGKVSYLNVKLQLIDQLGSSVGINETGDFGFNSLFYNDENNPSTGFLLSQIGDMVFGFKYSKTNDIAFDSVKKFVDTYMSQTSN